jgi:hypothetical protein
MVLFNDVFYGSTGKDERPENTGLQPRLFMLVCYSLVVLIQPYNALKMEKVDFVLHVRAITDYNV